MTKSEIQGMIQEARGIAASQANQIPRAMVYSLALGLLDDIEVAMDVGPLGAFEASRPLGVLAVRELEDLDGAAGALGSICFKIRNGLRRLAGLPYYA